LIEHKEQWLTMHPRCNLWRPTMFDLESALIRWRRNWPPCPSTSRSEVENHLREEVERLVHGGNTTEQAFLQACQRLGDQRGYPLNSPSSRAVSLATGASGLRVNHRSAGPAPHFPRWKLFFWKTRLLLTVHASSICMGYITITVLGGLGTCFVLARPFRPLTPGQSVSLRRGTLCSALSPR
jgi:hypothetical protein